MVAVAVAVAIGGWFASGFISKVFDEIKDYLKDNHDLDARRRERLDALQVVLLRMEDAIDAAGARPIKDDGLAQGLRYLKDVAYEIVDLRDDFISSKVHASIFSDLQTFRRIIFTDDHLKKLNNILERQNTIDEHIAYVMSRLGNYGANITPTRLSHHDVIGRNTEMDVMVELLLNYNEEENVVVLPIVGIGGIGKTAVARHIFEDERLFPDINGRENHFSWRSWKEVSNNLDIKEIANYLVSKLDNNLVPEIQENNNLVPEIQRDYLYDDSLEYTLKKLESMIRNHKFLIVLDNVWNVNIIDWERLHASLAHGIRGSTVLITTQYQRVAKIVQAKEVHRLELDVLTEGYYQQLFEQCAFGGQNLEGHRNQDLQLIDRDISQTLQGLPSAAIVLGNMLRCNPDPIYRTAVFLDNKWWEHDDVLVDVLPSLAFNYQNLNASQKRCFAYCSIFPRGYHFEESRLVHIWMAQDFIYQKARGNMRTEDIGTEVFSELVNRNFFRRISETNEYVMPDIMRELAVYLSLDECFVIDDRTEEIPLGVHHLSVAGNRLNAINAGVKNVENLRTILFFGDYEMKEFYRVLKNILKYSKRLRVLGLSNCQITKLPKAIGNLSHLRYLDISDTNIHLLPELFCKLCHLQVLNLQRCHFNMLPEGMNKLINLRHLYAESSTVSLISGIGKLTCLQELREFHVRKKKGQKIEELRNLNKLRGQLLIQNLENVDSREEAMNAELKKKKKLRALHLYFEMEDRLVAGNENTANLEGLLEGLEPCCDIKELNIRGYDCNIFPTWLVSLSSLKKLIICDCPGVMSLPENGLPASLEELHILRCPPLREWCHGRGQADWQNFPHALRIRIDEETI